MELYILVLVALAIFLPPGSCMFSSQPTDPRKLACDVSQNGLHLNLHCELNGQRDSRWDRCVLRLHLPRAFFVDPYELKISRPGLNFTITRPKPASYTSSMSRWFSWFLGNEQTDSQTTTVSASANSQQLQSHDIDVEAPEWLAEPIVMNFRTVPFYDDATRDESSAPPSLNIPLHLRYRLPTDPPDETSSTALLPYPTLHCTDGGEFNTWDNLPSFPVEVPVPPGSDLMFVMPITILLLTVGLFVLLLA